MILGEDNVDKDVQLIMKAGQDKILISIRFPHVNLFPIPKFCESLQLWNHRRHGQNCYMLVPHSLYSEPEIYFCFALSCLFVCKL